jgi:hypothetical protein
MKPGKAAGRSHGGSTPLRAIRNPNAAGKWNRWHAEAIPHAEQLHEIYLKERAEEEEGR